MSTIEFSFSSVITVRLAFSQIEISDGFPTQKNSSPMIHSSHSHLMRKKIYLSLWFCQFVYT